MSKPANQTDSGAGSQTVNNKPRWEAEWSNIKRRREIGENKICGWRLFKKKTRHIAREHDVTRQRASNMLKYGDVEVPDEVVL